MNGRRSRFSLAAVLLGLAVFFAFIPPSWSLPLARLSLSLSGAHIRHPLFSADGVRLEWRGGGGSLNLAQLDVLGRRFERLAIACQRLVPESGAFRCENGRFALPGLTPMTLDLVQQGGVWRLELRGAANERWQVEYREDGGVTLAVQNGSLDLLLALAGQLENVKPRLHPVGRLHGQVSFQSAPGTVKGALKLSEGGYATPDGREAAEHLELVLTLQGRQRNGDWQLDGALQWEKGAVYSEPVYLESGRPRLDFSARVGGEGWRLQQATLDWPAVGTLTASGDGDWTGVRQGKLTTPSIALDALGNAVLRPFLEARALPEVALSGRVALAVDIAAGTLARVELSPQDGGFDLEHGRLALEGLSGHLLWRRDAPGDGELQVKRLALGRLESGAFVLPLAIWPKSFALKGKARLPLLDGALNLDHLAAGFADGEWQGALGLSVEPLSLELLTPVLDLPRMAGRLSANLPIIRYAHKEAALDGELVIQVFDGYLNCRDLRFIDPFGVRPRILADVDVAHLDLSLLTQTFSFGEITGFVDASLHGLELANWQPLAFDARIASSPGKYPKRISQRAVDNITALSGGGVMASLQASALRFFEDFGYRRIGLSCRLENGVCRMAGIAGLDRGERYAIIEGGGIPALTVMGYNRAVDWEALVSRIKAAINAPEPIIQ